MTDHLQVVPDDDPDYIAPADDPFLGEDPWDDSTPADDDGEDRKTRKSVATQLVELAEAHYRLAVTDQGDPVAFTIGGPNLAHPLRGGRLGLRASLARLYLDETGRAASSSALADALLVIEGKCQDADEIPVAQRVGSHDDGVVIDLGGPDGRAVVVTPGTWQVVDRSPVAFMRSNLTAEMSLPVRSDYDVMGRPLGNIGAESWPLVVGWLLASFIPGIPHPIAFLRGEMGTGKTTMARRLVDLVDPSTAPVRSVPRDLDQWVTAAAGSWVVALDNLSTIPGWLSDALCRAVTGEGLVKRRLYTDGDLAVIRFHRVALLTAIDGGALAGDLADRVLPIDLERIDTTARRTDADLSADWEHDRPMILGALFDVLVDVLAALPGIELDEMPRMADFARVLAALDRVRPSGTSGTLSALPNYLERSRSVQADVADDDPVAAAIVALVESVSDWEGTAAQLLDRLEPPDPKPRSWPSTARALGGRVRKIAPALRSIGVTVDHDRIGDRRIIALSADKTRGQRAERAERAQTHKSQGSETARREPPTCRDVPNVPDKSPGQAHTARTAHTNRPLSVDIPADPFAPPLLCIETECDQTATGSDGERCPVHAGEHRAATATQEATR